MIVTYVHVWVKEAYIEDFITVTKTNHDNSVKEPGNLRFDISQDTQDKGKFILYEAYEDEASAAKHKETNHYKVWRDTVADWMAQPRKGETYKLLYI